MSEMKIPLTINDRGAGVAELQKSLLKLGYQIPQQELEEQLFGVGTRGVLRRFRTEHELRTTGQFDERTAAALARAVAGAEAGHSRIEGRLFFEDGRRAAGVRLRLYAESLGGAEKKLADAETDGQGFFHVIYDPPAQAAGLEIRAVNGRGAEIALSKPLLNPGPHSILNLVAPRSLQPLEPEYDRLTSDLVQEVGTLARLGQIREDEERRDITLLRQATGWDARLIALAATAVRLGAETKLSPKVLYALFRVGLPTDKVLLAGTSAKVVNQALAKAKEANVVRLSQAERKAAKTGFEAFSRATRGAAKAPGTLSSLGEMLEKSGLTSAEQHKFEDVYFAHEGGAAAFWKKVRAKGIPVKKINALRLQGKLAHLTLNNAALGAQLGKEIESPDNLARLVAADLDKNEGWKQRLTALADGDQQRLAGLIPPAYTGATTKERLSKYAADLSRKVRLSFPTHVARRMVERDELMLGPRHEALKAPVATLLHNAAAHGFVIGRTPFSLFLAENRQRVLQGIPERLVDDAIAGARLAHRLWQITPSDGALRCLSQKGFRSAYDVVSCSAESFRSRCAGEFLSPEEADLIYRKAQQVTATTLNALIMARLMDIAPPVFGMFPAPRSPAEEGRNEARRNILRHFPGLEGLLGSVDYCACEHCRSVLSPAAYLVDLLQFLEYPTGPEADRSANPYHVLTERRPDLPELALTCANTNTALPYIDIVNEILEYCVVNRQHKLRTDAIRNTGDETTAELLAEPPDPRPDAYNKLRDEAVYPLALPFDLWLETTRQLLNHFGIPFWRVLETFRTSDTLFPDSGYGYAVVWAEYLGLSPVEHDVLTDPDWTRWYQLYGYDSADAALTVLTADDGQRLDLNSAKTLSRKLGVSYAELVELVGTAFVNPGLGTGEASRTLVLVGPATGCDFNETTLRFESDPGDEDPFRWALLKLNLFVRLWRKLGWTIEELDRMLQVCVPGGVASLNGDNLGAALKTALIRLAHLEALREELGLGKEIRLPRVALWSDPPETGPNSPHEFLAAALGLSSAELQALRELSGFNPFPSLPGGPLEALNDDQLFNQTLAFVGMVKQVKESGFSVEDLDYLLRHRFDPVGKYRPVAAVPLSLVKTLAAEIQRIRAEQTPPDDVAEQQLIGQMVVDTLARDLNADPVLVGALATDVRLLRDLADSSCPLLDLFAAAGDRGVSVSYFASDDGTSDLVEKRLAADFDITDKPERALSARFEGYLEVPKTGSYHLFLTAETPGVGAVLCFDHLPDPLLQLVAGHESADQSVELQAGIPYRFTLSVLHLDGAGVNLSIERGEELPRGSLTRLVLYPEAAVERVHRARLLLGKAFQIIGGLGLSEREVRHLLTHPTDFGNLDLSLLPTQAPDEADTGATALFQQWRHLVAYRRLKQEIAGGTDDLIGVFENARRMFPASMTEDGAREEAATEICRRLAELTRRDPAAVRSTAGYLDLLPTSTPLASGVLVTAERLACEEGVQKLWEALQLVETLGVPVDVLKGWATPAPGATVANGIRDAIKARYEPQAWRRLAQPIFDQLRQRRRDALVAYLLQNPPAGVLLRNADQLFEYLLIDPGMEPVVQTSRIRLAISSVQLFVQRCLLNLEPRVLPSALNARHWEWMKRYRLWEANRKIFLYPENWLEPEFRDDKTHLFRAIEGALLQGDVSNDSVEDAFLKYLQGLEELARLDIVAMYYEDESASKVLHVIGRTFAQPHKYFYRRYEHQTWTAWEPVTCEIEGDHVAAAVWRNRLHVFWVTFIEKQEDARTSRGPEDDLRDMSLGDVATEALRFTLKHVEAQLNWAEYYQGQWTPRATSGFAQPMRVLVPPYFDRSKVFLHLTQQEPDTSSAEGTIEIHLHLPEALEVHPGDAGGDPGSIQINPPTYSPVELTRAFRLVNKNSPVRDVQGIRPGDPPYDIDQQINRYQGSGALTAVFRSGEATVLSRSLNDNKWSLSLPNNLSDLFNGAGSPFFYADDRHTFFVEQTHIPAPDPEEQTVPPCRGEMRKTLPPANVPVHGAGPIEEPPDPSMSVSAAALFAIKPLPDWATHPLTMLLFDEQWMAQGGRFTGPPNAKAYACVGREGLTSTTLGRLLRGAPRA